MAGIIKKLLAGATAIAAVGSGYMVYDIKQKQVYTCQPFTEAMKQYFTVSGTRASGAVNQKKLEDATKNVCKTQENFLMDQLKENNCTEYGRLYGFNEIKNICDFRKCHPLTRYEHFQPYIERMMCGECNILTKDCPVLFATSAATSGYKKVVPVLQKQKDIFFNDGINVFINCITECFACPNRDKLYKDAYFFHNPCWRMTKSGVKMGPNEHSQEEMQEMMHMLVTPEPVLGLKQELETMYIHLLFALQDCKLGVMSSSSANIMYYAFKTLDWDRGCFVKDIANGTLNPKLDLRCDIRRCLEGMLKGDCERAKMIEQAFSCGIEGLASRIWPDLQVVACIDSGTFTLYGEELRNTYLKGIHMYSPLYYAAEGLFGVNIWPRNLPTRYLLHPCAAFFELIPIDKIREEQPETCLLTQAEVNQMYEVVITNSSGLYRYRLGDIIKVCGFHHEAPIVEFMYRESQKLNLAGEELNEHVFYNALTSTLKDWPNFKMVDYVCIPSNFVKHIVNQSKDPKFKEKFPVDKNCYFLFMEPCGPFTPLEKEQTNLLDAALTDRCAAYQALREKGVLGEMQVQLVQPRTFVQLKEVLNIVNETTSDQHKVPRVITEPEAVECLLKNTF